jgi:hypothetical protein
MLSSSAVNDVTAVPREASLKDGLYAEDLPALAALEYRLAHSLCRECKAYHALWGYSRIAGVNRGVATDETIIASMVPDIAGNPPRVLIAGAADAGLLALMARVLHSRRPQITVADRCATPLALCERFAAQHSLPIATCCTELMEFSANEPFDLILAHYVLNHIPTGLRLAFLGRMRASLGKTGKLLLACRAQHPASQTGESRKVYSGVAAVLSAMDIPLPDTAEVFQRHIATLNDFQQFRDAKKLSAEEVEALLAEAHFRVTDRHDRFETEQPASSRMTRFLLATPA